MASYAGCSECALYLFKVYSLVRGALRVDLYDTTTEEDVHINKILISAGFAQFREESAASKVRRGILPDRCSFAARGRA